MTLTKEQRQDYITREFGSLVGKTVQSVRPMSPEEIAGMGWEYDMDVPWVIIFSDGTALIPSADPEGNSSGHAFIV